jgi:predicted transposase/invertase (TIGR01784 family)
MLLTEWKLEEALVVEREEGREEGREETKREDARNFLALGVSPATVAKATGLDMETIMGLSTQGTE